MGQGDTGRVRATQVSAAAWDVVLDAGRRQDVPAQVWAELAERGMAKGERLTSVWQDVATSLGAAPSLDVVARRGELQHRTTVGVLGRVCLLQTRRARLVEGRLTGEPRVLVQAVAPDDVMLALAPVLPPVPELRADPGSDAATPFFVPLVSLPLGDAAAITLDERPVSPAQPWVATEDPGPGGPWLTPDALEGAAGPDPLTPPAGTAEALGSLLAQLPEDPDAAQAAALLGSLPGVDPRLAALLGEVETSVTVTRAPARSRAESADEALAALGGLALRQWFVLDEGLVSIRVDRSGLSVVGVEPGDLAREVRHLVAGELPEPADLSSVLGEGS